MEIRILQQPQLLTALQLVWEVFADEVAPETAPEGVASFRKFITYDYIRQLWQNGTLVFFGAYEHETLCGTLALRSDGHIALFFVKRQMQGRGMGRRLFQSACHYCSRQLSADRLTVHATPGAAGKYAHMGMRQTAGEQERDGIRYVPMEMYVDRGVAPVPLDEPDAFGQCIRNVRESAPLIHNITNYVTANDVANILLACGASPVMSDEPEEVEEITALAGGLNINLGTPSRRSMEAMFRAGRRAAALGHVLVFDPVGAGASTLRTDTAVRLMEEIPFTVIRGNISEIRTLALGSRTVKGVDADVADRVTEDSLDEAVSFVREFAGKARCIAAVTGAVDLVSDGSSCYLIRNGRKEMGRVTGTGCQLSALLAAFLAANPRKQLTAAAAAVCAMGLAGELAWECMQQGDGNAAYRNRIIDAVCNMDEGTLKRGANYEVRQM